MNRERNEDYKKQPSSLPSTQENNNRVILRSAYEFDYVSEKNKLLKPDLFIQAPPLTKPS